MFTLFASLLPTAPDPPQAGTYGDDLVEALAAAACVIAMLVVIYLVFRATYVVIRLFSEAAFLITLGIFISVVVIGVLNR
jgi:hypothetical protein